MFKPAKPQHTDRETARERLERKVESTLRLIADPNGFSTYDPQVILADARFRLRFIDCAPEGANHQTAPLQDKRGVPMGDCFYESVEAGSKALREAIERKTGRRWQELKTEQAAARRARQAA